MLADRMRLTAVNLLGYLKSLMHLDNSMLDSIANFNWLINGNSYSTISKFGTHSVYMDGLAGGGIAPDNNILNAIDFSYKDWTMEMWVNMVDSSTIRYLFCKSSSSGAVSQSVIELSVDTGILYATFRTTNEGLKIINAGTFTMGQWNFIRFGRKGSTFFCVKNGTKYTATALSNPLDTMTVLTSPWIVVGSQIYQGAYRYKHKGYIDEYAFFFDIGNDATDIPTSPY